MQIESLHIKNMVCRRCVMTVEDICRDLGITNAKVSLGIVNFEMMPNVDTLSIFSERLKAVGFEPLKSHEHIMLENVKAAIRFYARHDNLRYKLSEFISNSIKLDFRYISRLFSSLENRTIQSYLTAQRIEYVKELLFDNELTLAEIADKIGFSSVAYLSRTFKKSQGITISEFRNTGSRLGIDEL